MTEPTAEAFHRRVRAHATADGRLPVPAQAGWEVFPFEPAPLVAKRLEALVLPEPLRSGECASDCSVCADPEERAVWSDQRWLLLREENPVGLPFQAMLCPRAHLDLGDLADEHAAELGQLIVRLDRAVRALDGVERLHVNRWGDGAAHLHLFLMGRPSGLLQLRGSNLALWEEMLPRLPRQESDAALHQVAQALAHSSGRLHS